MASVSSVACTIVGRAVNLRFPDGSESDVPIDVVNRSKVLQDSICATECDGEFLVGASPVHLQRWLECVRLITAENTASGVTLHSKALQLDSETLAEYLEASDYMADDVGMNTLCELLGEQLRQAAAESSDEAAASSALQVLQKLPDNLVISVLRASPFTFEHQLADLPTSFHPLSVCAAFPELTREGRMDINCSEYTMATIAAVLRACSHNAAGLKKLRLRMQTERKATVAASSDLVGALQQAVLVPEHVALQGIALQRGVLPKLFNALSTNTSLRTLELCALPICDAPEAPHTAAGAEDAIATPMHDADPPMHDVPASGEQASTSNGTSRETRASAKRKRDGVNAPVATAQGSKPPGGTTVPTPQDDPMHDANNSGVQTPNTNTKPAAAQPHAVMHAANASAPTQAPGANATTPPTPTLTPPPPEPHPDAHPLTEGLQSLTRLRSLTLRNMESKQPQLSPSVSRASRTATTNLVVSALTHLTQLSHLCCLSSFLDHPDDLARLLTSLASLRVLDLKFKLRFKSDSAKLGAAFKHMHGLHAVTLKDTCGWSMGSSARGPNALHADALVAGLTHQGELEKLDLSGCWMSKGALDTLIAAISPQPKTSEPAKSSSKNTKSSNKTKPAKERVDEDIAQNGSLRKLQSLALKVHGDVATAEIGKLLHAVGSTGTFSQLHLSAGVKCQEKMFLPDLHSTAQTLQDLQLQLVDATASEPSTAAPAIGKAHLSIPQLPKLTTLCMTSCRNTPTLSTAFKFPSFSSLTRLHSLAITGSTVIEEDRCMLVAALPRLPALRSIHFSVNQMQDCSGIMETLVATLQALKQLRRLCLQRCDLDDVIGTAVVSDGLGTLKKLSCLDLSFNDRMGNGTSAALAELLHNKKTVRKVALRMSGLTTQGAQQLLACMSAEDPWRCMDLADQCERLVQPGNENVNAGNANDAAE